MKLKLTLVASIMVAGMAFVAVHRQCEAQRMRYRVAKLADEVAHLQNENRALEAKVAVLTAPPVLRTSAMALKIPAVRLPVVYVTPRVRVQESGARQ